MALIRWGLGSELYIYQAMDDSYVCCACSLGIRILPDKEKLKEHILIHKAANHSIGEPGNRLSFQSYDQLLEAVDKDDF
jgi:hypothetical protein